jgi:hypothetical protein
MAPAGILFYSQSCRHCTALLESMRRLPPAAWSRISMVCIDGRHDSIPSQIDRVPALIIPAKNAVVFGAALMQEVAAIAHAGAPQQQQQQQHGGGAAVEQAVEPFTDHSYYGYDSLKEGQEDEGRAVLYAAPGDEIKLYGPEDDAAAGSVQQQQQQHPHQGGLSEPQDTRRAAVDASQMIERLVGQREQDISMRGPPPNAGEGPRPPVDPRQQRDMFDPKAGSAAPFQTTRPHLPPPGHGAGHPMPRF